MIYTPLRILQFLFFTCFSSLLMCMQPHGQVNLRYHHLLTSSSAFALQCFQQEMIGALDAHFLHNDASKTRAHLVATLKSIDLMSKTIEPFFAGVKGTPCEHEPYLALSLLIKINKKIRAQLLKFEDPLNAQHHEPDLLQDLPDNDNAKMTQDLIAILFMMQAFTESLAHDVLPDYKKPLIEIAQKMAQVKQIFAAQNMTQQDRDTVCTIFNQTYLVFLALDEMLEHDDMNYPPVSRARTNIRTIFLSVVSPDQRYLRHARINDLAPQDLLRHVELLIHELSELYWGLRTKYVMLSYLPWLLNMSPTNEREVVLFLHQLHELSQRTLAVTFSGDAQENFFSTLKDTCSSWLRSMAIFLEGKAELWQGRQQAVKKFHGKLHEVAHKVDLPNAIAGLLKARHTPGPLRFIEYCLTDTSLGAQAIGMMLLLVAPDKMELIQKQLNEGRSIALIADELRRCISMFNLDNQADTLAHFLKKYRTQVGLISSKVSDAGLGLAERKLESAGSTFELAGQRFQKWSQQVGKKALSKEDFMYWCNGMAAQGALNIQRLKAEAQTGSGVAALLVACEKSAKYAHDRQSQRARELAASDDEGYFSCDEDVEQRELYDDPTIFKDPDNNRASLLKKVFDDAGMDGDVLPIAVRLYTLRYQQAREKWFSSPKMQTWQQDRQKLLAYSQQTQVNPMDMKQFIQHQKFAQEQEFWDLWIHTRLYQDCQDANQERREKEFRFHEARRKYEALLRSLDGVEDYIRREEKEIDAIKRAYWLLWPLGYLKRRGRVNSLAFWSQKKSMGIAALNELFEEWAIEQQCLEQAQQHVEQKRRILERLERATKFSAQVQSKYLNDEDFAFVLGQMGGIAPIS